MNKDDLLTLKKVQLIEQIQLLLEELKALENPPKRKPSKKQLEDAERMARSLARVAKWKSKRKTP